MAGGSDVLGLRLGIHAGLVEPVAQLGAEAVRVLVAVILRGARDWLSEAARAQGEPASRRGVRGTRAKDPDKTVRRWARTRRLMSSLHSASAWDMAGSFCWAAAAVVVVNAGVGCALGAG